MGAGPRRSNSPVTADRPVDAASLTCPDDGRIEGATPLLADMIGQHGRLEIEEESIALVVDGVTAAIFTNRRLFDCINAGFEYEAEIELAQGEHFIRFRRR